jgi:hypothetical protein
VNDDDPNDFCGLSSAVRFQAQAGTTYRIAVDGFGADEGALRINIEPAPPPANDDFANAVGVTQPFEFLEGYTNVDATGETGEPNHAGVAVPLASVWFKWTAAATGPARIATCGSGMDSALAVYTGEAVGALTPVAANDDDPAGTCGDDGVVNFAAQGGTTYRIAIDGVGSEAGSVRLQVMGVLPPAVTDPEPSRPPFFPPVLGFPGSLGPPSDTTAPAATLARARAQKLGTTVDVTVNCGSAEDCRASATGKLSVPGPARTYSLTPRKGSIAKGKSARLRLKIPRKARAAAAKALRRRGVVKANVAVAVADAAGNVRTLKQTIRLRR